MEGEGSLRRESRELKKFQFCYLQCEHVSAKARDSTFYTRTHIFVGIFEGLGRGKRRLVYELFLQKKKNKKLRFGGRG